MDVDPDQNAGARYFVEAYYVSSDDAPAGNQDNNASWREITFSSISSPQPLSNGPSATNVGDPAIRAWAGIDPSVVLTEKHAPDDGLILIGVKVFDNGNGTWDYDYAIHNMNCDRSINVVEIPTGSAIITNVGFKDIDYNSGEIYDNADWSSSVNTGSVSWNGATYAQNPNGNALRWGTMYNFRFTATAAPESGSIELGLFKPGGADSFAMTTIVPAGDPVDPCDLPLGNCPEDIDESGFVGVGDLLAVVFLVWLLNLYNFMDGIDGIASIEAITSCMGASFLFLFQSEPQAFWLPPLLLAFTAMGFLYWNFPQAKVFMGDAGSGFIGFMLGLFLIQAAWESTRMFWIWIILLGVFIVDATLTLLQRIIKGEESYKAHRKHAYQVAARQYGSHKAVSLSIGVINILWLLPMAYLVSIQWIDGVLGVIIAFTPLVG